MEHGKLSHFSALEGCQIKVGEMAKAMSLLRLAAALILLSHGGQTSNEDSNPDFYDPWKDSDRPKVLIDYHSGPLRGRNQHNYHLHN